MCLVTESASHYDWHNTQQLAFNGEYLIVMEMPNGMGLRSQWPFQAVLSFSSLVRDQEGSTCPLHSPLGLGAIAGMTVGAAVFGIIMTIIMALLFRWIGRRRQRRSQKRLAIQQPQSTQMEDMPTPAPEYHRAITNELHSKAIIADPKLPHPGLPVPWYSEHPPRSRSREIHPAQELPGTPTRTQDSPSIWQGPGIAMVLPPQGHFNPSAEHDLTLAQEPSEEEEADTSTTRPSASPQLDINSRQDDEKGAAAERPLSPPMSAGMDHHQEGSRSPKLVAKEH